MGLLHAVGVTAAAGDDARAAPAAWGRLTEEEFPRRRRGVDQKDHPPALEGGVAENGHSAREVVRRPEGATGFGLKRARRRTVDRERSPLSCEALIRRAMTQVMLNRLYPPEEEQAFH